MKGIRLLHVFFISASIFLQSCGERESEEITVAAAANMRFVMEDLTTLFTKETGIICNLVIASSGKLTAQIKEGAPYDIFISADMKYPDFLYAQGLTTGPPQVYAYGKLVLWTAYHDQVPSMERLIDENVKHIAVAQTETAPYGRAALEAIKRKGYLEKIQNKLVYAGSISQVNHFVSSQSVDVGFTSLSTVLSPDLHTLGSWAEVPDNLYEPIVQGLVLLKSKEGTVKKETQKFYEYLSTNTALSVVKKYGYITAL
ncbi:molybdate ABC transporter substrate-binding protein [Ascidiimonas aurantiaca]|uniref:molybdate ABC transporter substrate-binding protein n=1 Tax=Ascidiimonas aurantiaca TaxID=1685432 RepID=UPI0030EC6DD6